MTQEQRRVYLIDELLAEQAKYQTVEIPQGKNEQERLLRSLMNVRAPQATREEFLAVQDKYLQKRAEEKGIVKLPEMTPVQGELFLWRGDITRLAVDAIVNAANSGLTGCYCPCHGCIDNAIHTFAGVQLRLECGELLERQGHVETTGKAKITKAYNLPCKYVLHTVGPIVTGELTRVNEEQLASCYRSCLTLAEEYGLESIAFCCISTGEFHFPKERAAELAVWTVKKHLQRSKSKMKVIFNVFKTEDYKIYKKLLRADSQAQRRA